MSNQMVCDPPVLVQCQEKFRLSASGWINNNNIGDTTITTPPPAGIRLRWNCPFWMADPQQRLGEPSFFRLFRSEPLNGEFLKTFKPTVGHIPRSKTAEQLWARMNRITASVYGSGDSPCDSVDAVYFEVPAGSPPFSVCLTTVNGSTKVMGELKEKDRFYFELAGISRLVFSADLSTMQVWGLSLDRQLDSIKFTEVAAINARRWTDALMAEAVLRVANSAGEAFTQMTEQDWLLIQEIGRRVHEQYELGNPVAQTDIDSIKIACSMNWDLAAMMGMGFTDGEHPNVQGPDLLLDLLSQPDGNTYAYFVMMETSDGETVRTFNSTLAFTEAVEMKLLEKITAFPTVHPVTRSELTNQFAPSDTDPVVTAEAEEYCYCTTEWQVFSSLPGTEIMVTLPMAETSLITGEPFQETAEFYSGTGTDILHVEGLDYFQFRTHRFRVPFFDSDCWLNLVASDNWGRRMNMPPTKKIQPDIEYKKQSVPVAQASCSPSKQTITIDLDKKIPWQADQLAIYCNGNVELLMKNPLKEFLVVSTGIGQPYPTVEGNWAGMLKDNIDDKDFARLLNGTLIVEGFTARIISLVRAGINKVICTFETSVECAAAQLYPPDNIFMPCRLEENLSSSSLWLPIGHIGILPDGTPQVYQVELNIVDVEKDINVEFDHSMNLTLSTRLVLEFEEENYRGPVSLPLITQYLHPAPKKPDVCFDIKQLGTDYFGRGVVRVQVDHCSHLEEKYRTQVRLATGKINDEAAFAEAASEGLFGAQQPLSLSNLFEVFPTFADFAEGIDCTVGLAYYRAQDNTTGSSTMGSFEVRKTDNG